MTEIEKALEGILMQLAQINAGLIKLTEASNATTADLKEFSERFEEVVTQLEDERRLDLIIDYN